VEGMKEVEGMNATMVNWSVLSSDKRGRQLEQGSQLKNARDILGHGENFQKALKMFASESELETYKGNPRKPDCIYDLVTKKSYGKWKFLFPKNEVAPATETEETIPEEPSAQAVYRNGRDGTIEEEKAKTSPSRNGKIEEETSNIASPVETPAAPPVNYRCPAIHEKNSKTRAKKEKEVLERKRRMELIRQGKLRFTP